MGIDYQKISELLALHGILNVAAEVHGMVCGQLGSGQQPYNPSLTCQLVGADDQSGGEHGLLLEMLSLLAAETEEQFSGGGFSFMPLLPDDDEELGLRTHALGRWCDGFNMGFAAGLSQMQQDIPVSIREVLSDFARIAEIEIPEEGDEEEADYAEIVEYIRVAANTVYLHQNDSEDGPKGDSEHQLQ